MSTNRSNDIVTVSDWNACYNSSDNLLVVSCSVSSADASPTISGIGLIVNDSGGTTLASFYSGLSSGSEHVYPACNLPPGASTSVTQCARWSRVSVAASISLSRMN